MLTIIYIKYLVQSVFPFLYGFVTGMWAVVNNAGLTALFGEAEFVPVDLYHKCMDVNLYGTVRTIRRFLYMIRESKGIVFCLY